MHRRTFLTAAATGTVSTGLAASFTSPAIARSAAQWRLLALWPEGHPITMHLIRFAAIVKTATRGELNITIVPRGPIPPPKLLAAVGSGEAEMGHAVPYLWRTGLPSAALMFIFPFGLTAREKKAWLAHGGGLQLLDRIYGEAGCKYLPLGGSGPQMGGWFKASLQSAGDLKGLRIRIAGLGASVMAAAGAVPSNMSPFGGKIQAALKAGELDAAETQTPAADLKAGYPRLAQVYHYPNWHEPSPTFDLFINRAKWEALSDHARQAVALAANMVDHQIVEASIQANAAALETMVSQHGTRLTPFPSGVLTALARHAAEIVPVEASKDPLGKKLYESLADFRKTANRWTSVTDHAYLNARDLVAL